MFRCVKLVQLAILAVIGVFLLSMPVPRANAAELIMLEEAGCWWCEKWNKEIGVVYHKTPEGRLAPLRRVDIHERLPVDLQFLNKGRYTPTFVLIEEGREYGRIRGYPGEDFFWGWLGQMLERLPKKRSNITETSN